MSDAPADLVLASASPRRRELLERAGLRLHVHPAAIDESRAPGETARAHVERLAAQKCDAVAAALRDGPHAALPVLAADTVVTTGPDVVLGKPADAAQAASMLRALAGRQHEVLTATCARLGERRVQRTVTTQVRFRLLDEAELAAYVACGEWRDKAGGYAIQGRAALFVTELRGSLTSVIGLPLSEAIADLRALGALPGYPRPGFGAEEVASP